ncbi:MAG: peptidoglycan editing factor PgeF [Nitrospirae bacterium]|nr:MAG: peptidoglycan editing factor PgeF [Nitrospirota bacterium]
MIVPDNMRSNGVSSCFTNKTEGSSPERVSTLLSVKPEKIYLPRQRHTDIVAEIDRNSPSQVADAVITNKPGILLGIRVADCLPILLYDPGTNVIGAVHAGWRGTAKGILQKTIKAVEERFGSNPANILLAFGPSIRWCCYEVQRDVLDAVKEATGEGDFHMLRDGKICLDLASANIIQATQMGVPAENIWISGECTYCKPEKFNSYRYNKTPDRQGGFITIKEEG